MVCIILPHHFLLLPLLTPKQHLRFLFFLDYIFFLITGVFKIPVFLS